MYLTISRRLQNIGLTYNMRISRPGISLSQSLGVDKTVLRPLSYGNTDLDVEKAHNIGLVYNLFNNKFMMNVNLHQNFCNNAIEQYSFYDTNNMLNTTYGNVVKRSQTGLSVYTNWAMAKSTRLIINGGVSYNDLRSDALDMSNNGWRQGNLMVGAQQTLPWDIPYECQLYHIYQIVHFAGMEFGL